MYEFSFSYPYRRGDTQYHFVSDYVVDKIGRKLGVYMSYRKLFICFAILAANLVSFGSMAKEGIANNQSIILSNSMSLLSDELEILRNDMEITKHQSSKDVALLAQAGKGTEGRIERIEDRFNIRHQALEARLAGLEEKFEVQLLSTPNGYSFTVSSIILTGVAALVTALGVMIAILSVIGYRDLKEKAAEVAEVASSLNTQEYLSKNLEGEVEKGIVSVFESKKLDHKITEIFMKVAMQGISTTREEISDED